MAKRGLNDIPVEDRDYDPSFLRGNPSNRVGFLGVDGPQRPIAVIGAIALLLIAGAALFS